MTEYDIGRYYNKFRRFLDSIGWYHHIVMLEIRDKEGVYPAQEVAVNYHKRNNYEQVIKERNLECWNALEDLDKWAPRVGLRHIKPSPIDDELRKAYDPDDVYTKAKCQSDKFKVIKFFEDKDHRRYARDNIKSAEKRGEILSVADIMLKRYRLEAKKKRKEEEKEAGD